MYAQRSRASGPKKSPSTGDSPTPRATIAVTATVFLLMMFSIVSWKLSNTTLSAVAGTAACTLAGDAIRRYLGDPSRHLERELVKADDDPRVDR
ncbi:hypothetical protein OG271_06220 [Micromonospora rifamycinica]|uniref:hypothetical protein n=1 Tax=Micromonospora rifamycinica TaxID=291594 RepID=UPI002E29D5CF|nr:hypothetical protein [Micromonospora rifamycinica]